MEVEIDRVEAEAIHPALQPETHGFKYRGLPLGVMEIKIWLGGQKITQGKRLAGAMFAVQRDPGFAAANDKHKVPVLPELQVQDFMTEELDHTRMLALPNPPTAVICSSMVFGAGRIHARG